MAMVLYESAEMYLETIHILHEQQERVRAVDIANYMGYSKPTISEWMGKLRDAGYVEVDNTSNISLTPNGEAIANRVHERHQALTHFFTAIGVDPKIAEKDACRVEHYISDETYEAIIKHLEKDCANQPA